MSDLISRQAVLSYINRIQNQGIGKKKSFEFIQKYVEKLPPVNPQPCEDAISRKVLISHIENQIREWGEDYDAHQILGDIEDMQPQEPKKCKDCKWWRDSDGYYRRGVFTESKCPINRKEVFEGNGYCYMFESQESEDK